MKCLWERQRQSCANRSVLCSLSRAGFLSKDLWHNTKHTGGVKDEPVTAIKATPPTPKPSSAWWCWLIGASEENTACKLDPSVSNRTSRLLCHCWLSLAVVRDRQQDGSTCVTFLWCRTSVPFKRGVEYLGNGAVPQALPGTWPVVIGVVWTQHWTDP